MVDRACGTNTYFHKGVVKAKSKSFWANPVRGGALMRVVSQPPWLVELDVSVLPVLDMDDNPHFEKSGIGGNCDTSRFLGVKLKQDG
jgi:hypothetical protein